MNTHFSVLMSVYQNDQIEFVKAAIESVLNQTLPPSEIIIVIDGPISSSLESGLSNLQKNHEIIKFVPQLKNGGLGNALKEGMKHCSYDLVARMDSDDISLNDRFFKQINCFLSDETLSLVGGFIEEFIGSPENIIGIRSVPLENEKIIKYIKKRSPMNHVSVMFKKSEVEKAGGYLDFHYNEDSYLWIRMILSKCKMRNIKDILVNVRISESTYSRRGGYKYFISEKRLYDIMIKNKMINLFEYLYYVGIRFIIQILMPNHLRKYIYSKFFRKHLV